ncbi:hypothetical protein [Lentzea guizhouensis]|nr:hypothetical protein [Lentzea guizhouensis]
MHAANLVIEAGRVAAAGTSGATWAGVLRHDMGRLELMSRTTRKRWYSS